MSNDLLKTAVKKIKGTNGGITIRKPKPKKSTKPKLKKAVVKIKEA